MVSPEYLAGLIDGEGYIGITKRDRSTSRLGVEFEARVQINMTRAKDLLEEIAEQYCGKVRDHKYGKTSNPNWEPQLTLMIRYNHTKKILEDILPYLCIKKRQAELVLKFLSEKCSTGGNQDGILLERVKIYNELRYLNARGPKKPKFFALDIKQIRTKLKSISPVLEKEQLYDLYWVQELSPSEIAKKVGKTNDWISELLKQYEIPKRGHSKSQELQLKKFPLKRGGNGRFIKSP